MTKSLLTEKDIKNFILAEIDKAKPRQESYFVRKVLCRKLNLNEMTFINNYEKNGLKYSYIKGKRKFYNLNQVIKWLDERNIPYTVSQEL